MIATTLGGELYAAAQNRHIAQALSPQTQATKVTDQLAEPVRAQTQPPQALTAPAQTKPIQALPSPPLQIAQALSVLQLGDEGPEVRQLQERLAQLGYLGDDGIDGVFGEITEAAVFRFQEASGLLADGVFGPETASQLLSGQGSTSPVGLPPAISAPSGTVPSVPSSSVTADLTRTQADLAALGYYSGSIDGLDGPLTQSALRNFQAAYALRATGVLDALTLQEIDAAIKGKQPVAQRPAPTIPPATLPSLPPAVPGVPSVPVVPSPPIPPVSAQPLPPLATSPALPPESPGNSSTTGYDGNFFPFVVAVPDRSGTDLFKVRQFNSQAFLAGSRLGPYIHAGAYARREDAEALTQRLRAMGLDARVVYRPR